MRDVKLMAIHPGEILREEYLAPLGLSAGALARRLRVPRTRIERLCAETSPVTVDTALRLSRLFRTSPEFWLNLQTRFDVQRQSEEMQDELEAIEALTAA